MPGTAVPAQRQYASSLARVMSRQCGSSLSVDGVDSCRSGSADRSGRANPACIERRSVHDQTTCNAADLCRRRRCRGRRRVASARGWHPYLVHKTVGQRDPAASFTLRTAGFVTVSIAAGPTEQSPLAPAGWRSLGWWSWRSPSCPVRSHCLVMRCTTCPRCPPAWPCSSASGCPGKRRPSATRTGTSVPRTSPASASPSSSGPAPRSRRPRASANFCATAATHYLGWGIAAAVVGIVGNQLVARYKLDVGRAINSATLIADAKHSWLDALSSVGAAAGLIAVLAGLRRR